ncbi:hypothetical protein ABZU76_39415 [Amycolatopsis sp. NPDC005232]|uniref:hypothetical protein n=1 Tax=Amycolatopsis sp. NPDC005232 TaxID=3157027 RepID=UPI0033A720F9
MDRVAALAALISWAERRKNLSSDRADLMAVAWRTGTRNVAELARVARVSRDTVYADLAARGVDPGKRDDESAENLPEGEGVLSPDAVRAVGELADTITMRAYAHAPSDPVVSSARAATRALTLVADVLDPPQDQGPGWTSEELLRSLADEGSALNHHAARALAEREKPDKLAAAADLRRRAVLNTGRHGTADGVEVTVSVPAGSAVKVRFDRDGTGWTTLAGDSPLIDGPVDNLDHLEVGAALAILGRVVTRHLTESALVEPNREALPEMPPPRTRVIPGNED